MKEAFGNTFIVNIVILFVFLFTMFFVGSITYTKAFKVKNKIINIIEKEEKIVQNETSPTEVIANPRLTRNVESLINEELSSIGYRIDNNSNCSNRGGTVVQKTTSSNYRYCITRHTTKKGSYYGVTAYMYFEIPIIGVKLEFPVFGETKIIGIVG